MGVVELAAALLGASAEVAHLAAQAIDASRMGDDATALALLDQAIAKQRERLAAAEPALEAVRERINKRIADKFDSSEETTTKEPNS